MIIPPGESKSAGLMGRPVSLMTSRSPLRHTVYRSLVPGSGPRSRSKTIGATSSGRVAAIRVRRSRGRLTNWLASAPSRNVSANALRSGSDEASGLRASVSSTSGISRRTQMTAPVPRARNATAMEIPRARLDRSTASSAPTGSPM